uniref:Uncharacterized protein n=1 Tax=Opuntia streptacantha TaxID=393608 RepID=A0A7C9APP1_OPUST
MGLNFWTSRRFRMASRYWTPMHLSSWAPRANILPSEVRTAAKGEWAHLSGSTGTESRWELNRMEGRSGLDPGQVRRTTGFPRTYSRVRACNPMERAWSRRKETGSE